jgi:hypothetical protein
MTYFIMEIMKTYFNFNNNNNMPIKRTIHRIYLINSNKYCCRILREIRKVGINSSNLKKTSITNRNKVK